MDIKRFGGTNTDYLTSIHQIDSRSYVLTGFSYSALNGDKTQPNWDSTLSTDDAWIVKIDSVGNKIWDRRFGSFSEDGSTCFGFENFGMEGI